MFDCVKETKNETKDKNHIVKRVARIVLFSSLFTLVIACSDDDPVVDAPEPDTPVTPEPTEPPEQVLSIPVIPEDCTNNSLCSFAANAANSIAGYPDNTCQISEASLVNQLSTTPDIQLTDTPHAYASNSGWLSYALNQSGDSAVAAYTELQQFQEADLPWPRAYIYQQYFSALVDGVYTSDNFIADEDLNNLQAGHILSWCDEYWCGGRSVESFTTGYLGIVLNSIPVSVDQVDAILRHVPTTAEFFQVGVVDVSHRVHGNEYENDISVIDYRHDAGPLKDERCFQNGGLGAGVIILAQWLEGDTRRWAYALFNDENHFFSDSQSHGHIELAFAAVNQG